MKWVYLLMPSVQCACLPLYVSFELEAFVSCSCSVVVFRTCQYLHPRRRPAARSCSSRPLRPRPRPRPRKSMNLGP